jgi:hypothetical protein
MEILSFDEAAKRCGVVRRTLERLISVGEGPAIVRISARRRGIIDYDLDEWAQGRRIPRPGRPPDNDTAKPTAPKAGASQTPLDVKPGGKFRRKVPAHGEAI